ncbi:MAG: glycoside hydrolase, partial [Cyanobacteria bacterium J06641_5]
DLNAELADKIDLQQGTLGDFIRAIRAENLPHKTFTGDLIGNDDHPILASVFSARLYLKQQNHQAQNWLVDIVEPLSAWLEAREVGAEDARPFLTAAWQLLLRNHPHDDICGCSVDPVHDDGEVRFREVNEIAEGLAIAHLEALLKVGFAEPIVSVAGSSECFADVFVFNPHPWEQTYRAEARILFPNPEGEWGQPTP